MDQIFKLKNTVKHYDWGSPVWIPQLVGKENPGELPWAELWMGVHPEGPSETAGSGGGISLPALISRDPPWYLGKAVAHAFGTLPFLFKVLAAAQPLSIQAHPNEAQARQGWERENQAAIPLTAPNRNYKDPYHKPEILCALTPFKALCGFREPEEIIRGLAVFSRSAPEPLKGALASLARPVQHETSDAKRFEAFLKALFGLSPETRQALSAYTIQHPGVLGDPEELVESRKLAAYFAEQYPGDPAVLAPLYLNRLDLMPGEAVYLPAGVLHAYIHGFGVELMANSDNVLRGGLTPKHVDLEELLTILNFSAFKPEILRPIPRNDGVPEGSSWVTYPTPCREFSLSLIRGHGDARAFPGTGPSIVLVTEGKLTISGKNQADILLETGESAFISAGDGVPCSCTGTFTLYAASIGSIQTDAADTPDCS
ncbi:MAG: mannose-6-phosphate isomerase, class I [Treponema sp.]|nr:mannose-6-phosphate isomerase, class I [Treponema sp.]